MPFFKNKKKLVKSKFSATTATPTCTNFLQDGGINWLTNIHLDQVLNYTIFKKISQGFPCYQIKPNILVGVAGIQYTFTVSHPHELCAQ